jgi:hypothetical protein
MEFARAKFLFPQTDKLDHQLLADPPAAEHPKPDT